jgi:hypothetical protein
MKIIKKIINDIMFVTGSALVILTVFSLFFNVEISFVPTVFQIFAANIVIIIGLFLRGKFEIRNLILEYLIDISYIIAVLILFGFLFNWFSSIPAWLPIIMAVVIYIFATIFTVTKLRSDAKELNILLEKHHKKQADNAS